MNLMFRSKKRVDGEKKGRVFVDEVVSYYIHENEHKMIVGHTDDKDYLTLRRDEWELDNATDEDELPFN